MWSTGQNNPLPPASGAAAGGWGASAGQDPSADSRVGYHQGGAARGGGWGAPRWPDEARTGCSGGGGDSGGGAVWTAVEDEKLRKSVKENGLDDWTLGDWSEVAAAVGGGKTPEQCFNRWHAEYNRQVALEQQRAQGGYYDTTSGHGDTGASYAAQQQQQQQCWPQHPQGAGAGAAAAATAAGGYPYYPGEATGGRPRLPPPDITSSSGQKAFRLHPQGGDGHYRSGGGSGAGSGSGSYPNPSFARSFDTREPDVHPELSASWYGSRGWHHTGGGGARPGGAAGQGDQALRNLAMLAGYAGQVQAASEADEEDA